MAAFRVVTLPQKQLLPSILILFLLPVHIFGQSELNDCGPIETKRKLFDCSPGWTHYEAKCYLFVQDELATYADAQIACQKNNARLLRIGDHKENFWLDEHLTNIALDTRRSFYTAGRMDSQRKGQFIWEGHPTHLKSFSNSLVSFWLEPPPRQGDGLEWPPEQTFVVYGYNNQRWGFYLRNGDELRPFICESQKELQSKVMLPSRDFAFGATRSKSGEIQRGPCIQQQPQDVLYFSTDSVVNYITLQCVAYGVPQPTYQWYRVTGTPQAFVEEWIRPGELGDIGVKWVRFSITGGTLTINKPTAIDDAARFQCEAENIFGKVRSRLAKIMFGTVGHFPKESRSTSEVHSYRGQSLDCLPPYHTPDDILRYTFRIIRNNREEDLRPEVRPNLFVSQRFGAIYFSSVTSQDNATYICIISVERNKLISSSVSRKSQDIPMKVLEGVFRPQKPLIVDRFPAALPPAPRRGEDLRIECMAYGKSHGTHILQYEWKRFENTKDYPKTKRQLELPRRTKVFDFGRVLFITNVTIEDSGNYECVAVDVDKLRSDPLYLNLQVQSAPFFTTVPQNQHVDVGGKVHLVCRANALPPAHYAWYLNGVSLDELKMKNDGKIDFSRIKWSYPTDNQPSGRAELIISNVMIKDEGMYGCRASNALDVVFAYAQVRTLSFAPNFDKEPLINGEGVIGNRIVLECNSEAAPSPVFTWFHKNEMLTPVNINLNQDTGELICATKYCKLMNGNLYINQLTKEDGGNYTCQATNSLGSASSSAFLRVIEPMTTQIKPANQLVMLNTTLELPCAVKTAPFIDIDFAWFFEGVEIKFDRYDMDRRRYELVQFTRPYRQDFGTLRISNIQFDNEGNYTCKMISPVGVNQEYAMIRVMGPPSPCAGVILPPINNETNIPIKWTVGENHYSTVMHYKVEIKLEDTEIGNHDWQQHSIIQESPSIIIKEVGGDYGKRASVISNLPHNRTFRARISAANGFGYGEASSPSEAFLTAPGPPASKPLNVSGGGGKRDTLVINWLPIPPQDHGGMDFSYDINFRVKGNVKWETMELIRSINDTRIPPYYSVQRESNSSRVETVLMITGEDSFYRLYEVRVRGRNKKVTNLNGIDTKIDLFGEWSDIVEVRSAQRVPTLAPENVAAAAFNQSALTVFWTPIENNTVILGGVVSGYRIVYWKRISSMRCVGDGVKPQISTLIQRQTVYGQVDQGLIIGLDTDTYYCIRVQMFNSAGDGPESNVFEMTTFKSAPLEYPTMMRIKSIGEAHAVQVSWVGIQTSVTEEGLTGYAIRYWVIGAPPNEYEEVNTFRDQVGIIRGLSEKVDYNVRVYGYSRGGVGRLSSPMIQLRVVPSSQCSRDSSYETNDIRYYFLCNLANQSTASFVLMALVSVSSFLIPKQLI